MRLMQETAILITGKSSGSQNFGQGSSPGAARASGGSNGSLTLDENITWKNVKLFVHSK